MSMEEQGGTGFVFLEEGEEPPGETAATSRGYPPDRVFKEHMGVSFTWVFAGLAILGVVADYVLIGSPSTGIPYNYPLVVGGVYVVVALFVLRGVYGVIEGVKRELISINERTTGSALVVERAQDTAPERINADVTRILEETFHPFGIVLAGGLAGVFTVIAITSLNLHPHYPHTLTTFAYGAAHGFLIPPIIAILYLLYKTPTAYTVDLDLLAPDGAGGYTPVGSGITTLAVMGTVLVTLDYLVLASLAYPGLLVYPPSVLILYLLVLAGILAVSALTILGIRRRLRRIHGQKTARFRGEFNRLEHQYWTKHTHHADPQPEGDYLATLGTMLTHLRTVSLWPINRSSVAFVCLTALLSLGIAAYAATTIPLL